MNTWPRITAIVESHGAAALVSVMATQGSVPREAGACMIVRPDGGFHGSIGGGTLEWQAQAKAQAMLAGGDRKLMLIDQALGPDLGQCCGGRVTLAVELFDRSDGAMLAALAAAERAGPFATETRREGERLVRRIVPADTVVARPSAAHCIEHFGESREVVALFGAGHVGRAVALALAPLPFRVLWHDERPSAFPAAVPANAEARGGPALAALVAAPEGAQVLVMTHSHALDLEIVAAALADQRFSHVGLIGSATKRARFAKRLAERGLPRERIAALRCPVGLPSIGGKEPAVIAASVAAECLILRRSRSIKAAGAALRRPA